MKDAVFANALKTMRAKEITLRLDEIGGAAALAVCVEIAERIRKGRSRCARQCGLSDDGAQRTVAILHHFHKSWCHEQIAFATGFYEGLRDEP